MRRGQATIIRPLGSRSRAACATETERFFTSLIASTLNPRLDLRRCMTHVRLHETPNRSRTSSNNADLSVSAISATNDGQWVIHRKRQAVYAKKSLPLREQIKAASRLV